MKFIDHVQIVLFIDIDFIRMYFYKVCSNCLKVVSKFGILNFFSVPEIQDYFFCCCHVFFDYRGDVPHKGISNCHEVLFNICTVCSIIEIYILPVLRYKRTFALLVLKLNV